MYNSNEKVPNPHQRMPQGIMQAGGQQRVQPQQPQQGFSGRSLWRNQAGHQINQQHPSVLGMKTTSGRNVHGKQPMLMANNDVFSIGPYKARKDSTRVSVLDKYEIIGYIAAGTYGKVYKAKRRATSKDDDIGTDSTDAEMNGSDLGGLQTRPPVLAESNGHPGSETVNRSVRTAESEINALVPDSGILNTVKTHSPIGSHSSNGTLTPNGSMFRKNGLPVYYAIKKFKTERDGVEQTHYTGISQSACREMALCRELDNRHLTQLAEIFLERKSIYMVYEFAEHDLLQIIHFHSHPEKRMIPQKMIGSIMWQILDGVSYLHQNWILHRDLKPANIMVTVDGCVKVGDLGLARKFYNMLQTLYTGDKVVVTIWYRAPELLLGARHYTPAIDLWAVGCIFAELIGLQPIFKGEEAKMDSKKSVPFQSNQLQRILEVLGSPNQKNWPSIHKYPEYEQLSKFPKYRDNLATWYHSAGGRDKNALDLLYKLLTYDPTQRIDAVNALDHEYFTSGEFPVCENVFEGLNYKYPARRIHTNDNDITNLGIHRNKGISSQQPAVNNSSTAALGGLGVNRRILAAAAAAAAAVSGSNPSGQPPSRSGEPNRKKRR